MAERNLEAVELQVQLAPPAASGNLDGSVPLPPDVAVGEPPQAPVEDPGKKANKDKKAKRDKEGKRPGEQRELKPWERYRALADAYEVAQDLLEFGDRKVRFGLVVIGAINIVVFGAAFRAQSVVSIPLAWRPWIMLYLTLYAFLLVYGVRYAISALRPRIQPTQGNTERAAGLHFHEDILRQKYPDYEKAWRNLPIGELSSLLARQIYSVAHINRAKFFALQRMYASINLMVVMTGGFLVIAVLLVFGGADMGALEAGSEPAATLGLAPEFTSREYKLILLPERFADVPGRPTDDSIKRAIAAYWAMVGAESPPLVRVHAAAIEQRVALGPSRHRLLQFLDASVRPSDAECKGSAAGSAFFYDCKGLVLRSRVAVKPFEPARGFEIDDSVTLPFEITLKSRSPTSLSAAFDQRITAIRQAANARMSVESKIEKDMTAGRSTYGQSCKVEMSATQARAFFSGKAPQGPGIAVPQDLAELQRLFTAPQLKGAENRPVLAVTDYAAYEQVYKVSDAIEFPDGVVASMTMSFWYDMQKELKVVEASWRIEPTNKDAFPPLVVGSAEQFLDHLVGLSQRRGWFNGEAQTKKTQALSAIGG